MKNLFLLLLVAPLLGCATVDTTGFSKDQLVASRVAEEQRRTAWTLFGISFLTKAAEIGLEQYNPRGDGFKK